MTVSRPAHQRILLKLSGEALMGEDAFGIKFEENHVKRVIWHDLR